MKNFLVISLLCMIQLYAEEAGIAMGLAGAPESSGQDTQDNDVEIPHTKHPHPHHNDHHKDTQDKDTQDSDHEKPNSTVMYDGEPELHGTHSYSTSQDTTRGDDAALLLQFRPRFNDDVLIIPLQHYDNDEDDTIEEHHIFSVSIIREYIEKNITHDPQGRKFTLRLRKMLRFFGAEHSVLEDATESDFIDMMRDDIRKISDLLHNLSDWLAWNAKPMVAYDPKEREIRMVSLNGNRFTVPIDFLAMGPEGLQNQVFELYRKVHASDGSIQKYAKTVEDQSESSVHTKQSQELAVAVRYYENKYKSNQQFIDNLFENAFKIKSGGFAFRDKIKMLVQVDKLTSMI